MGMGLNTAVRRLPTLLKEDAQMVRSHGGRGNLSLNAVVRKMSTLNVSDATAGGRFKDASQSRGDSLSVQVRKLPTLTVSDANSGGNYGRGEGNPKLTTLIKQLGERRQMPTLLSSSHKNRSKRSSDLQAEIGGPLNPAWCEWWMDFPEGWTELKPLAMLKFQSWQQSHISFSNFTQKRLR